jgi:amino acid transporter
MNARYVTVLGLLSSTFSFSGYEAGAHMAEETTHASRVSERDSEA